MKPQRLSTRRLIVLVAIAGLIVWCGIMWRRSAAFRAKATENAALTASVIETEYVTFYREDQSIDEDLMARNANRIRRLEDYYRELSRKYARAALNPWLPVEPDPPKPRDDPR